MRTLALAVTKILNPVVTSLATVIIVVGVQQISVGQKTLWLTLGFLVATLPMTTLYWQYQKGAISSLWSPTVEERRASYLAWSGAAAIFSGGAFWLDAPRLILAIGLVFLGLGIINLLLSSSFKISIHSELVTLLVITGMLSVSLGLIYLTILIFVVAWARLYLKAHTLSEITSGAFVAIFVVYFVFSFFGLVTF